jgi:hypothetical protein
MVKLSRRDLEIIAVALGGLDFYLEGALTAPVSRAFKAAFAKAKPAVARGAMAGARAVGSTAVRGVGTVAAVGRTIAMRHPYIAAGAVIYVAAKNREQIADLIREGYDVVEDRLPSFERPDISVIPSIIRKKPMTAFNKSVKKGMSIVKQSTSYGKKGTINNAKKAFAAVTKVASAASKKKKAPKKGITRKIYLGIKGLFK